MKIHVNLAENPQQNQPMLNKKPQDSLTNDDLHPYRGASLCQESSRKKTNTEIYTFIPCEGKKKNLVRREKDGYLQNYDLDLLNLSSAEVCKLNIL